MASVRLEGVRKVYEDGKHTHVAVHGADLDIRHGELIVLVGPSGSGKSTLLRMIAGLESITAGRLLVGDKLVNDVPAKERDMAMVFQNYALYPHMTAYENMAFALKLRRLAKAEIDQRVREAAAILGIETLLERKPRQMSGGQRQRVAVGRALVRHPQVFLFDEPLSNLDAKLRVQMRHEIARLHRRLGATMIYVTHDQVEAMTLGDRIVVLSDGHVRQTDTPLALYERPRSRFVAEFIGSPAMNIVAGTVSRGSSGDAVRFASADGSVALDLPPDWGSALADGNKVLLGVRPEDVEIREASDSAADLRARLELVELTGHEIIVHASLGAVEIVARGAPRPLPDPGADVGLRFDRAKLHLFDAATEERLGGGLR